MFNHLKGIRVVELGTVLAGPIAGALLGDLGAEVIKVEPVEGEAARLWPPVDEAGESAFYLAFNRSKKGIWVWARRACRFIEPVCLRNPSTKLLITVLCVTPKPCLTYVGTALSSCLLTAT